MEKYTNLWKEEIIYPYDYFAFSTVISSNLSLARTSKYFFSLAVARNGWIFCLVEGRIPMMRRRSFESSRPTDLIDIAPAVDF